MQDGELLYPPPPSAVAAPPAQKAAKEVKKKEEEKPNPFTTEMQNALMCTAGELCLVFAFLSNVQVK